MHFCGAIMKKVCFIISFICFVWSLSAQVNVDSLWSVWSNTSLADTVRLKSIQSLAWSFLYSNPDSTYTLAVQELAYARQIGSKKWEAKALNTIGSTYNVKGDYTRALSYYQRSLVAVQETGDKQGISTQYNNIGIVYQKIGQHAKSLEYYQKDQAIQEELGDKAGIANAYNNLGNIYSDLSVDSKAIDYFQKSQQLYEYLGDKKSLAITYNNLGSVYLSQDSYALALDYLEKSLQLRKGLNDQLGIAIVYINLGRLYRKQRLYAKALEYHQKGIAIQIKLKDNLGLANSYFHTGLLYMNQGQYEKTIQWCKKSWNVSREIKALLPESRACNCLYNSYKSLGQSGRALAWYENYVSLMDSLKKEETNKRLEQLEFEKVILTDSLVREQEKQQIKVAYQTALNKKTQTQNIILVVSVGVLLLALVFLSRMLYFQKRSEGLQDKTQLLEKQQLISEIDLLKTQVNPHFLFNSLSILSSLVRVNPDLSEQFIEQLARSYRYILEQKDQPVVTLRTELEFIRSYAFLLKIRFENKFDLRINLNEDLLDKYKVAPLTLQLLVENAVKHNRMSVQEPLVVEVLMQDNFLVVKNQLRIRPQREASTGTGLHNIINRYALLTDRPVKAGECEDEFIVRVPLLNTSSMPTEGF